MKDKVRVLETRGLSFLSEWYPKPIHEAAILRLQKMLRTDYELSTCDLPAIGDTVEVIGDEPVRGVLIDRGQICKVAIALKSLGKAVCVHVPIDRIVPASAGSGLTYIQRDIRSLILR